MEKNDIGVLLRKRRLELRLAQKTVTEAVGSSPAAISRLETGKTGSLKLIVEVATYLGISFTYIVDANYQTPQPPGRVLRTGNVVQAQRPKTTTHGTSYAYTTLKCRCEKCTSVYNRRVQAMKDQGKDALADPNNPRHGRLYSYGCRCDKCADGMRRSHGRILNVG